MDATTDKRAALAATAAWRPMAFGDRPPARIENPLYEPLWPGRRVLVDVGPPGVTIRDADLGERPGVAELRAAIAAANLAVEVVLDGYLVPAPLEPTPGEPPGGGSTAGITARAMLRQFLIGGLGQSSAREAVRRISAREVPLPPGAPIGFVAVDLLWLDGEPLLEVPLGERKRLLEAVVADGELVRRTVPVRPPVERSYAGWHALGFREIAVKAANSHYTPGGRCDDWTITPIPFR